MNKYVEVSYDEYRNSLLDMITMHPLGYNVVHNKIKGVLYRSYIFEDMFEWDEKEYSEEREGRLVRDVEFYSLTRGVVCRAIKPRDAV